MLNSQIRAWECPIAYLRNTQPDEPVLFCAPSVLHETAERFIDGFPGLVTFAVKANPDPSVITNLLAAGIRAFDVASPTEIGMLRRLRGDVALHYNNPVKSRLEIEFAWERGVRSFALDSHVELDRIASIVDPREVELSVRFKLPIKGGHYDFGSKFGMLPADAAKLLARVAAMGFRPSLAFHPGTQCLDPQVYASYVRAARDIAVEAGVTLRRLNVGGGFPSARGGAVPELESYFAAIGEAAGAFGDKRPMLVCEPGRAMVGPSFSFAVRIKSIRENGDVFLNDGIYGGLAEFPYLTVNTDFEVVSPLGQPRQQTGSSHRAFGPTCDSADVLPQPLTLPGDAAEGDFVLFHGMGAYVLGLNTDFNGYGRIAQVSTEILRPC